MGELLLISLLSPNPRYAPSRLGHQPVAFSVRQIGWR